MANALVTGWVEGLPVFGTAAGPEFLIKVRKLGGPCLVLLCPWCKELVNFDSVNWRLTKGRGKLTIKPGLACKNKKCLARFSIDKGRASYLGKADLIEAKKPPGEKKLHSWSDFKKRERGPDDWDDW